MTSRITDRFSPSSLIAAPPYLTTTVLPANALIYGNASIRTFALSMEACTFSPFGLDTCYLPILVPFQLFSPNQSSFAESDVCAA